MKNKFFLIIGILSFAIISLSVFVIVNSNKPTAKKVFKEAQYSVVELKSSVDEDTISYGSAVFISNDGTLVTNAHMVTYKKSNGYVEFNNYEIRFSFEKDFKKVSLLKYDVNLDLAFLKLDSLENIDFKKIKIGDSKKISSGDLVYAVGNGMNHGLGITKGIISIPEVKIDYENIIRDVIQADLIINEGNSGGALLNEKGALIGITTFRLKDKNANIIYGIAFSIPIHVVLDYYNI